MVLAATALPASAQATTLPAVVYTSEAILAHELAHVRRHDYLVNLIQSAVETLMFYHPATWWISNRIREERENRCDDVATQLCGDVLGQAVRDRRTGLVRTLIAGGRRPVAGNGEPLDHPDGLLLLLHKPVGRVCSHDLAEGPSVYDLLPPRWRARRVTGQASS